MRKLSDLKISPAPWRIADDGIGGYDIRCSGVSYDEDYEGEDIIAQSVQKKDASMLAAAPKLYECLREAVLEMCHECLSCGGYPSYECKDPNDRCFMAKWRAALAEAAGEEVGDGK